MARDARGFAPLRTGRRLVIAVAIAGAGVALLDGVPVSCRDAVAQDRVVRLCEPLTLTDLPVALFALTLTLALAGEVGEVGIAGVVTLRREVAQAKETTAAVERDVAALRLELVAIAQSSATARSETHVHLASRAEETALAVASAQSGGTATLDLREPGEPGAVASAAFFAGFTGLARLLPAWAQDVALVGFAYGDDGRPDPHASWRASTEDVVDAGRAVHTDLGRVTATRIDGRWVVAARAPDDAGRPLGVLVAVVRCPDGPPVNVDELVAAVEVAAQAYARLWLDMVGVSSTGRRRTGAR